MKKLRAIRRLFQLLLITFFYVFYYYITCPVKGLSRKRITQITMRWGKSLIKYSNIKVQQFGKIPDEGVLFISNHRSYIDIALIAKFIPCTFLSKAEVANWPVIGIAARLAKVLFVKRDDQQSRKQARELVHNTLQQGISVIVFPEGTSNTAKDLMPFKKGVFNVAADGKFSVIPVAIIFRNPEHAWGDVSFFSHFLFTFANKEVECALSFGEKIHSSDPEFIHNTCWQWINTEIKRDIPWKEKNYSKGKYNERNK